MAKVIIINTNGNLSLSRPISIADNELEDYANQIKPIGADHLVIEETELPTELSSDYWEISGSSVIVSPTKTSGLYSKAKDAVKKEAKKRILEIAPEHKQRNMLGELARYASDHFTVIEAANQIDPSAPLPVMNQAHKDKFAEYGMIEDQIKVVRTASNNLETFIDGLTLSELENLDVTDNSYWI